jgi:hypothetical protein
MAKRLHTITAHVKAAFVRQLEACGNVRLAAQQVGFAASCLYEHRRRDPAFAAAWDAAMDVAMDTVLEPEAIRRAVDGVEKPVYHEGEQVGTVRQYSDTLLIFLLKGWRPERYRERREVVHRGTLTLLEKLEQVSAMSPAELEAFLVEVDAYMQQCAAM